ncbi:primosomal protein [Actinopolyspora erythraea]|uniref:Primosomal protein n=1 Tax=Actinopolyspora erythraea TaxID=414996 RepID=A0A099DA69_9ACTN|nr:hypothetical protein [Actinopolyspora erythraea]ASU80005.1 primosomal protein [Actinopolyspora erythraea]KGI82270.1 hypothetical protein IL38_05920 [Actinopolyspora erythraea]
MAQDIVPIELGLPQGDLVTLWAPRWREDGEEWEAFLGHEENLYAFPDPAHLAAFVRSGAVNDLDDHPAWHVVPALSAVDLSPDEDHQYDLVGVPELIAEPPDTWTINELSEIVEMARSLAEVCELDTVTEVLQDAEGFDLLGEGTLPFSGKEGQRRWNRLCRVVAERWDELLDAIDGVVATPEVDATAVATAESELAEALPGEDEETAPAAAEGSEYEELGEDEEEQGFWREIGIDPIKIVTGGREYYSLRCYLDDDPVFLGSEGSIDVCTSPRALARYLAEDKVDSSDLARVATWPTVKNKATGGELEIEVEQDNTYVLSGLDADLEEGPSAVDPTQLDLAEELLTDAAAWAGDESVENALAPSERLGWLLSFVLRPDPNRLPPTPPFDDEVAAWRELVESFEARLRVH